ncbi:hypothetical protein KC19_4G174800 [Ceratodon purpureus]|uniref:Uncharacterized protein n=1 Tax=Ceratodon purpureus TaxID=3225 RepID=A0A8T0ID69_CERPU|nr:hypothetical protein KC19_4G174800 [Ceratodon purpureus]
MIKILWILSFWTSMGISERTGDDFEAGCIKWEFEIYKHNCAANFVEKVGRQWLLSHCYGS